MDNTELPGAAVVVRGGQSTPELIDKGLAIHPTGIFGLSVVSAPLRTVFELASTIPYRIIRCTTVQDIRMAGGDVIVTSGKSPYHATLIGFRSFTSAESSLPQFLKEYQMAENNNLPRLFADFNNADEKGRVRLTTNGTKNDLNRLGIILYDGMQVFLDDSEEITALGIVRFSPIEGWVAEVDWDKI